MSHGLEANSETYRRRQRGHGESLGRSRQHGVVPKELKNIIIMVVGIHTFKYPKRLRRLVWRLDVMLYKDLELCSICVPEWFLITQERPPLSLKFDQEEEWLHKKPKGGFCQ